MRSTMKNEAYIADLMEMLMSLAGPLPQERRVFTLRCGCRIEEQAQVDKWHEDIWVQVEHKTCRIVHSYSLNMSPKEVKKILQIELVKMQKETPRWRRRPPG